jgi:hypothetical protein
VLFAPNFWAERKAEPDYERTTQHQDKIRVADLVEYLELHPNGFKVTEINRIVGTDAMCENGKTSWALWIHGFCHPNGPFARNGDVVTLAAAVSGPTVKLPYTSAAGHGGSFDL